MQRVLVLQRQAGNAAVARALRAGGPRVLARDPIPLGIDWTFSPTKPPAPDLYPWLSKDPAKRWKAEQDLLWASQRPRRVTITVSAAGLSDAKKTIVGKAPAPDAGGAASPASGAVPDSGSSAPQTVPVATSHGDVKGVQVQVTWGMAAEAHTKPVGPGAGKDESPSTDWQQSAQVALTLVYHDDEKPGWEWSQQFQVNWSDTTVLRALSPTALQNVQIGSQLAYVLPLWKNAQAQIFGQIMFGVTPDGKPVSQAAAGGQLQMKVAGGLSLFVSGTVGGTENSGDRNAPSYTGDASVQGGVIYQW